MVLIKLIKVFIQVRLSSKRLPKKVFKKIIYNKHTLDIMTQKLSKLFKKKDIVILTSKNKSDDLIEKFCNQKKIKYYRGSLTNVSQRFLKALKIHKCEYFVRISADSPLLDLRVIKLLMKHVKRNKYDIITNVYPRSFPKGQSVEIIRSKIFIENFKEFKNKINLEHVTSFFYNLKNNLIIKNVKSKKDYSKYSLALDTKEDLVKIQKILSITKNTNLSFLRYIKIIKGF